MPLNEPRAVALAEEGARRIAWARANMPVLERVRQRFEQERPLAGRRVGMCLHVRAKTAVLVETLRAGGAHVVITGSPATTDDGVALALARDAGVRVHASRADALAEHAANVERVLKAGPDLLLDNGADLVAGSLRRSGSRVVAATEETTTGAHRLREELAGRLRFPVVVVNDSPLKLVLENQHGVGLSVVEGFLRATNCSVAATTFAVVGYGFCGRGIARSLRGLGGTVIAVERDPVRALEAAFDGMRVMDLGRALGHADVVITATGRAGVVGREELAALRDGAILANAGHFGTEIDVAALATLAASRRELTAGIVEYALSDGRRVRLLDEGEPLNLTAASGNPIQVMDAGYSLQALSLRALALAPGDFAPGPQPVPAAIDREVALDMLQTLSVVELDAEDVEPAGRTA